MSKFLSFFSSDKLFLGLSTFLLVLIYFKNGEISDLKKELELKNSELVLERTAGRIARSDLGVCKEKLSFQNAAIKALESKKPDEAIIQERTAVKFQRIEVPVKDDKCEKKLKFYEELLNEASK